MLESQLDALSVCGFKERQVVLSLCSRLFVVKPSSAERLCFKGSALARRLIGAIGAHVRWHGGFVGCKLAEDLMYCRCWLREPVKFPSI